MKKRNSSFTISLDFELYWGVRDERHIQDYEKHLLGVWEITPKLLKLFQIYGIHVTWATVGFLFFKNEQELKKDIPNVLPQYKQKIFCPYQYVNSLRKEDFSSTKFIQMHFARSLIDEIKEYPFQEIATHTYSHYYTQEPKISVDAFESDMKKAIEIGTRQNINITSLVFPRNQIDNDSLIVLSKVGIQVFRGNPLHWAYKNGEVGKTFIQRVYRFIDIYRNLSGSHSTIPVIRNKVIEVKSSIFFRSYSNRFKLLERLKMKRIKSAMTDAAKKGENFHLWWHPHNFGVNQKENLVNLEEILRHFKVLQNKYKMLSLNMQELGEYYA